jgi:phosphate transport system permease protein
MIKDRLVTVSMAIGGIGVIIAIILIFFYLLYVVLPLFEPARIESTVSYPIPGAAAGQTLHLAVEEYAEVSLRVGADGRVTFFDAATGRVRAEHALPGLDSSRITAFGAGDPAEAVLAAGLADGRALLFRHRYDISYPEDRRYIDPRIDYPLGAMPIAIDDAGRALVRIVAQSDSERTTIAAVTADGRLLVARFTLGQSLLGGEPRVAREVISLRVASGDVSHLALSVDQAALYVATIEGFLSYYALSDLRDARLVDQVSVVPAGVEVTVLRLAAGGISLLVGDSEGQVAQWFAVRDENNRYTLARVRRFELGGEPITAIAPEHKRKGFAAVDTAGNLGIYHTTASRTLIRKRLAEQALTHAVFSPRADVLLLLDAGGRAGLARVRNEHPEISWSALWGKVWYESRERPEFIWQSSSASNDFEPKFSLTPLAFGTLKAAFYAMLFAVPLAIAGAIYTAYFMSARMRNLVKPTIELMEALPTVILGFLAGLWLAPLVEQNLPGIFCLLLFVPASILIAAFAWHHLPVGLRHRVPAGSEAALLIPVVCAACGLAMLLSAPIEDTLFGGSMPEWLERELGVKYDQRNSLVAGFAMGFAVVPIIFSISEDAVFSVPRHLIIGSLALGATQWQTMLRVVLLTASPGIFSGVMIGLGRAVGETMIVLMATGNTPVMDFNMFQGFRALSANIAVEMPESEVDSTHYRILFLAALVLFLATFAFNTVAEIVRQRLRARYSSL